MVSGVGGEVAQAAGVLKEEEGGGGEGCAGVWGQCVMIDDEHIGRGCRFSLATRGVMYLGTALYTHSPQCQA